MKTTPALATVLVLAGCTVATTIGQQKSSPDAPEALPASPVTPADLGTAPGDLAVAPGCVQLATWNTGNTGTGNNADVAMGIAWTDSINQGRAPGLFGGGSDTLFYDFTQPVGPAIPTTFPHALDFSSTHENLGIQFDLDLQNPPGYLVATSGDVTVTAADDTQPIGYVAVHGTNVVFQEVDSNLDVVPNGHCVQLGSFDLSGNYDNM